MKVKTGDILTTIGGFEVEIVKIHDNGSFHAWPLKSRTVIHNNQTFSLIHGAPTIWDTYGSWCSKQDSPDFPFHIRAAACGGCVFLDDTLESGCRKTNNKVKCHGRFKKEKS